MDSFISSNIQITFHAKQRFVERCLGISPKYSKKYVQEKGNEIYHQIKRILRKSEQNSINFSPKKSSYYVHYTNKDHTFILQDYYKVLTYFKKESK